MIYKRFDKAGFEIKGYEFLSARIMRHISIPIARKLSNFSLAPERIAVTSLALALLSALLFGFGHRKLTFIAGFILLIAWILDFVDGDMARLQNKATNFGAWLDSMAGKVFEIIIIPSICFAVYKNTQNTSVWILGFMIIGSIYFSNSMNTKIKLMKSKNISVKKDTENPDKIERSFIKTILHEATIGGDIPFYAIILGAIFNKMYLALVISAVYMLCYSIYTIYVTHKAVIELDRGQNEY